MRHDVRRVGQGDGEGVRRLADQIGLGHVGEEVAQGLDAALLGLAARDPEDAGVGGQGLARGVGVGALGIVDEAHAAQAAHGLHAVRQPREGQQAFDRRFVRYVQRSRRGVGEGGVLGVVATGQGAGGGQVGDGLAIDAQQARRRHIPFSPCGRRWARRARMRGFADR
ncbi:hypothetical protein FQZ97_1046270 [compost metagenome]